MAKITTDDCKQTIVEWILINPSYFGYRPFIPTKANIKRISKTTTTKKLNLRKFEIKDYYEYNDLYVLENSSGTLTVLKDDPDREWSFSIYKEEEPGIFCDRMFQFYGTGISPSSHVSFYLEDRLPTSGYETMESCFEFDESISDEDLISMLIAAGFKFLGYDQS